MLPSGMLNSSLNCISRISTIESTVTGLASLPLSQAGGSLPIGVPPPPAQSNGTAATLPLLRAMLSSTYGGAAMRIQTAIVTTSCI
eukprot:COSAG02_NODE_5585_length_4212_cov_3.607829_5_plen_86_part_00